VAKHAEHNLGKILSICVFQDKVLLMCNPKILYHSFQEFDYFSYVMFISE